MNPPWDPKTYRLAGASKLFLGAFLVFLPVVVIGVSIQIARGDVPFSGQWIFFPWLALAIIMVARATIRGVVRIDVENRMLRLRTLLRTITVSVDDVVSIGSSWWDLSRFSPLIRYRGGTVRLLGAFDEFYEFLSRVRSLNPAIEVKRL